MPLNSGPGRSALARRGLHLEFATLGWNVIGTTGVVIAAWRARSIALAGFGLDSLIEIFASVVVVWQLKCYDMNSIGNPMPRLRERRALQLISGAFLALGVYVAIEIVVVLVMRYRAAASPGGIAWLLATVIAMMVLADAKHRTGTALDNMVLVHEARVTRVDAYLAASVLVGLALNAVFGWWWADPISASLIVYCNSRVAWTAHPAFGSAHEHYCCLNLSESRPVQGRVAK